MFIDKNILYIISSISALEKIKIYTSEFANASDLLKANNQLNFNATKTLLIAIAEETKKIAPRLLQSQNKIESQNIVDMRNVLAHDYRGIDPEILFDVVRIELPKLKIAFLNMLNLLPNEPVKEILQTEQYRHLIHVI